MSNLADQIAGLSPEQLAQLTQRLQQKKASGQIVRQHREQQTFPLSFAQQRLWFLQQLQPDGLTLPAAVKIIGPLDVERLRGCFQQLCDRHEPLRTRFIINETGDPVQDIQIAPDWQLPIIDLQGNDSPLEVERLIKETTKQPFDLSQAPLLRTTILRLSAENYVLLFNAHHIIIDGWSLNVLIRELAVLYSKNTTDLPPFSIQYADYTLWQRQQLRGETLDTLLDYWRQQLQAVPTLLELPADRPRPAVQSMKSSRLTIHLSADQTANLKYLARQSNATLFMVGLAAFYVLLHRYTGQTDLLVGSPVANRNQVQTEGLMGVFVNTLALRTQLQPTWTFRQVLKQVRSGVAAAHDHQDLPFEKLIETLAPERSPSAAPLLQVMFGLQADPSQSFCCADLTLEPVTLDLQTSPFDLVLQLFERGKSIQGWFEYSRDLFDAATIERLAGHWHVLLRSILAHPDQSIGQLDLLSVSEHQQLQHWNRTQCSYPQLCVHEWVERQAWERPDAIALTFPDQQLTYRDFDQQANHLAHQLRTHGVGPETLVGICLDRSPQLMVAILAVWKAGGAYIPLDPTYPAQRLQMMVAEAQMLLTQPAHVDLFSSQDSTLVPHSSEHSGRSLASQSWGESTLHLSLADKEMLLFSRTEQDSESCKSREFRGGVQESDTASTLDHLAYVIYTSGSTGRPKGVMLTHRGLANLSKAQQTLFQLDTDSQVIQFASASFDASVWEMVMTWRAGATLHLGTGDQLLPGNALQAFLQRRRITHATLPPTALTPLDPQTLPDLKTIITAGEACSAALVKNWRPHRRFFNAYGPTETTICATVYRVEDNAPPAIGMPIANTQVYILDSQFQHLPIGIPGELYVSSVGLARGYLNRPGQTAASFIPNPFSAEPGTRLYRTGDLACYRDDGAIAFLGRLDHQVKLRGLRIELGEIEARLVQHPAVAEAIVIAHAQDNDVQLLAYCCSSEPKISTTELRQFIAATLPTYMVPNQFIVLETLPLLPNGKVDRKALPHPEEQPRETPMVAPRNQTEADLVEIWQRILNRPDIGVEDSFFELGGHSMLATQVITHIQTQFGISLPLRQIFEAPTIAGLAHSIDEQNRSEENNIPQISRVGDLPLSFAQQRLWFLEQLETTGATYHISTKLHLQGNLQFTALQQSLDKIVERHEILRTRFVTHAGQPQVVIDPASPLDLAVINLQGVSQQQQLEQLQKLFALEAQTSFDLAQEPLLRIKIVRLSVEEAIALVTLHHIIADGSSSQIFLRELTELYQGFSQNQTLNLPQLPVQYVDYAHWQRQALQGEILSAQLDYWQQQLTPLPAPLNLPFDHHRPPTQTYGGDTFSFKLPTPITADLRALAPSTGTTSFMVLLAVFKVLLYRYTGQTDIAVGSPIVNRNNANIEGLIGLFANTLVLRTDLAGNPSFETLLQRIRDVALGAYAHPDLPFEKLVEELQLPRDLSHSPLFQVMFAHQTAPDQLTIPGLTITPEAIATHTAKFDLTLTVTETETEITGVLEYNTDLFAHSTIERLAGHYQTLLEAIITTPEQGIGDLPLLTPAEQQQFIQGPQTELQKWSGLHRWFEVQVDQAPESIALEFASQTLTYSELNTHANQLARHLQAQGITPEDRVGLLLNRSSDMVVALLAVLKAGGTYLPLDPAYPLERLRYMVADAQVEVLITDSEPLIGAETVINVATDKGAISKYITQNLELETFPEQLAYVIYTSGSTGQPKGVQITHQAVINFLTAHTQQPGLTAEDVMLAVTSLSFDIAVLELLLPLVNGAKVLLASREMSQDGVQLGQLLRQATLMQATPATWRLLLASGWTGQPDLKILSGGEALPSDLAAQLMTCGSELWNLYGPTETTIWSTQQAIYADRDVGIGFPIDNTQVYILDSHLQQVPIGVSGELYIGGLGLARGYHQRPGLSAERFIPDPFSDKPGGRLYRTGDLACIQNDGTLRHLGRIDHQVKVRGFRIELGEIEAHLHRHLLIAEAVVIPTEGADRLVAYGQLQAETELTLGELQQWLQRSLPDYMVPAQVVWVSEFPLTPNGKLDRRALISLEEATSELSHEFVAPQTPTENQLTQIWTEILKIESVGIYDNFFELGGHSLLATQVVSRIRSQFSVELPLQSLFSSPTIATLATHLESAQLSQPTWPLVSGHRQQLLPLSFAQERLWFMDQLTPGNSTYNEPAMVVLDGHLDVVALQTSLDAVIERHEILRTTFQVAQNSISPDKHGPAYGQPVQSIAESLAIDIPLIDLQELDAVDQEREVEKLAIANTQTPFNLSHGPLLCPQLLQLAPEKHVLLFALHHIIADGWSKGILIQDLSQLYTNIVAQRHQDLPPLPIQYADFALWQRQQDFEPQLTYWRRQLGGDLPTLALPLDMPRPAQRSDQGTTVSIALSPQLSEALLQLSRQEETTLFMTLIAGFNLLLCCHTHQRDIVVGTDVANRNRSEVEGLIGFFVNLLVLRTDLSGNPSFKELLQRVKTIALGAYDHQDIPFAQLVDVLQPERQEGLLPLFQVLFVLQNAPMPAIELPDLTMTPTQPDLQAAKFDLALFIQETSDGLVINWNYSTDIFQATTINRLAQQYADLLQRLVDSPETSIEAIISQFTVPLPKPKRFQRMKNRAVSPTEVVGVSTHPIGIGLYQPQIPAVNLVAWAQEHRPQLEQQLQQSGALLFRGFDLPDASAFEQVAGAMWPELFDEYGDLPRTEVSGKVYGSTPYPEDRAILFHNESSHLERWPLKIWFFCMQPSQSGGETPIVDCRQLHQRLSLEIRDRFAQKKLMYERNFVPGLDVSWQDFFQSNDRNQVEQHCQNKGVECLWLENGGLRTRQVRAAIATHPHTHDKVFFNQLQLHHFSYIDPETQASLRSLLGDGCLPRQVYYGDGSDIEPEVLAEVNAAYQACAQKFTWQQGDVLMLDNMLMAHGRQPYTGPRKIVVALGQMIDSYSNQSAT